MGVINRVVVDVFVIINFIAFVGLIEDDTVFLMQLVTGKICLPFLATNLSTKSSTLTNPGYCIRCFKRLATLWALLRIGDRNNGAKLVKDIITIGIFFNVSGSNFRKPDIIGIAKKSQCVGNRWTPEKTVALYYHNKSA